MATLFDCKTARIALSCIARGDDVNEINYLGTPFINQCKLGNIQVIEVLIENKCNVTIEDRYGNNGLDYVCKLRNRRVLNFLLKFQEIINLINIPNGTNKDSVLMVACEEGHTDIYDILISHGADPNFFNIEMVTPLMKACQHYKIDIVDRLLKQNIDINFVDVFGKSCIFHCVSGVLINKLLEHRADINLRNNIGETPLLFYIKRNFIEENIINALLLGGADVNINNDDETCVRMLFENIIMNGTITEDILRCLIIIIEQSSLETLNIIKDGMNLLDYSYIFLSNIEKKGMKIVKMLLDKGIDVNNINPEEGNIFLNGICEEGNYDIFSRLISEDRLSAESINPPRGRDYDSPLHYAAFQNNTDIVEKLLELGSDPNYHSLTGDPVLYWIITDISHTDQIFNLLLDHNVDIKYKNHYGQNILCFTEDPDVIRKLILYGADPNSLDNEGNSVLYYHMMSYRHLNVEALLEFGIVIPYGITDMDPPPTNVTRIIEYPDYNLDDDIPDEIKTCMFELSWKLIINAISQFI